MITKNRWLKQFTDKEEILNTWKNQALLRENLLENKENFFHNQDVKNSDFFIPDYQLHSIDEDIITINFIFEDNNYVNAFLNLKSENTFIFQTEGVAINEEGFTATVELSGPQKLKLFAFAKDYFSNRQIYENFDVDNNFSFSGWALSLNQQLNPPEIKRPDGKKVTTAGSTILLPQQSSQIDEYVYQFQVQEVTEFLYLDFINIYKIKTRLALMPEGVIPLELYATERVIPSNYYPEKNHDIMGVFILSCAIQ
ncbi:MAG: hypothetical protein ACW967_05810 [Candidatus Hodarchaeales archaeon]|jgi:hypothetical protein